MSIPSEKDVVLRQVPDLPASAADLQRKSLRTKTLNDWVEDMFHPLYDSNSEFKKYLDAVTNADAVEGATIADDICAAQIIRDEASENSPIKNKELMAIRHALLVVLRRYGISRRERGHLLGGKLVNGNDQ